MKLFFSFLFFLTLAILPVTGHSATQSDAPDASSLSAKDAALLQKIADITTDLSALHQQAQHIQPQDAVFTDNYNLFNLLYLDAQGLSPLSADTGYGPLVSDTFGTARLVSAYAGTGDEKTVFLSVYLTPNPDISLKNISIADTTSDARLVFSALPVHLPLAEHYTETIYTTPTFIPLIYKIKDTKENYHFQTTVSLSACSGNQKCRSYTLPLTLDLPAQNRFTTSYNARMVQTLQMAPRPLSPDIQTQALIDSDNKIQLIITFPTEVSYFKIQPLLPDITLLERHLSQNTAYMILSGPQTLTDIPVLISSSLGLFNISVPLQPGTHQKPISSAQPSLFLSFLSGLLLFLCTPFWIFALHQKDRLLKNKRTFSAFKKITIACFIACGFLLAYQIIIPDKWIYLADMTPIAPIGLMISLIVTLAAVLMPYRTILGTCIFFWLIPKPYLTDAADTSIPTILILILTPILCTALLWAFLPILPRSFLSTKTPASTLLKHTLILKAPLIILTVWFGLGSLASLSTIPTYTPDTLQSAYLKNQAIYVFVHKKSSVLSHLSQLIMTHTGYTHALKERGRLIICHISPDSDTGKMLLKQAGLPETTASAKLLLGPTQKNPLIMPFYQSSAYFKQIFETAVTAKKLY